MKEENIIKTKSYKFSLRIIKLFKYLSEEKREFILSKQILRSGTLIGANVEEAIGAQSRNDFIFKMTIAYKEARETRYWICLLKDSGYLQNNFAESIFNDCDEICRILGSIQITAKKNL